MSGRAIASPTIVIAITFSRSTVAQIACGSILRCDVSTSVLPANIAIIATQSAAPCMSGGIGNETTPPPATAAATTSAGASSGPAVSESSGPIVERKKSFCVHMTPFGIPVVPPV